MYILYKYRRKGKAMKKVYISSKVSYAKEDDKFYRGERELVDEEGKPIKEAEFEALIKKKLLHLYTGISVILLYLRVLEHLYYAQMKRLMSDTEKQYLC